MDASRLRKAFSKVLKAAALPGHLSPHSLRHSFASQLLQHGESPAYVQRQLGHASIKLTVDTYGKWLPMGNTAAVDRLDDGAAGRAPLEHDAGRIARQDADTPDLPVARTGSRVLPARENVVQLRAGVGEPSGDRTRDPLIKSRVATA